ncbi:MAG: alpha-L-rhamnosidase [Cyclobacteriaceae bacterium]|nr:alpha-L-rhamnosidase [Cyclobacteriaceae bacterium]
MSEDAVPSGFSGNYARKLIQSTIPLPEEKHQRFASIRKMENINYSDNFIKGNGDLEIYPWGKITILIDQEHLTTAYPELLLSGGKGSRITLTYMEAPFIDVDKEYKGNRNEIEGKKIHGYFDIIYPNGDSNILYRPLYYRTFRYVQVDIENYLQPLIIHDFSSKFTGYPFKKIAHFQSSDSTLADIWNTGWRTARLCAYDSYMDCPYYEQLQYIGDTRIQALISLYMTGDDRLMRNAISQFHNSQIDEGLTQSRYPGIFKQVIPPFSLFWTLMVHDYWMHKQDDAFVKQFLKGILDVLEWHKSKIDEESGMLGKLDFWNFVDWPKEWPWLGYDEVSGLPKGSSNGNSAIHTLQYVYAINQLVEMFDAFGMSEEANEYKKIASSLKENTYRLCWDNQRMMMASLPNKNEFSQHANVLSVLSGIPDNIDAKDLLTRTINDTSLVECTVYYRFYLNQALRQAGMGDKYIEMLSPWRDMLSIGLTTFAEKPEPSRSDCHAWSASPNYDLLATVLGVRPGSPGFKTVKIEPHLGALSFAKGKVPCPQGIIEIKIERQNEKKMEALIKIPKGMHGTFLWNGELIPISEGEQIVTR